MTCDSDILERVALSFIDNLKGDDARQLSEVFGGLHRFFTISVDEARSMPAFNGEMQILLSSRAELLARAEQEMQFISKHNIKVYNILDNDRYPTRLAESNNPPVNLYVLGDCDLNADRLLAVVGTRQASPYGLKYTHQLIRDISEQVGCTTIVSGLAFGIDKASHEAAIQANMPTVAVVAHGLKMIYPALHRALASNIIKNGGAIVSEYPHDITPLRARFLARNRIVAGLSDAIFVAESKVKGGALSTAAHARESSRVVLALPGRASDINSEGCNNMINAGLAISVTSAKQIAKAAKWDIEIDNHKYKEHTTDTEPSLFDNYTGDIKLVFTYLRAQTDPVTLDRIVLQTGISAKDVMTALGELDFDGLLTRLPGARYALI
ncbi:MAG: DNA-processing protein DprA [Muribaculaceae bacterium]|nr:DNA-processing protein DprA [Muribaculaceae bacterium]